MLAFSLLQMTKNPTQPKEMGVGGRELGFGDFIAKMSGAVVALGLARCRDCAGSTAWPIQLTSCSV